MRNGHLPKFHASSRYPSPLRALVAQDSQATMMEKPSAPAKRNPGHSQTMIGLLAMVILVGMGEKMAERFLPIYLMALGGGSISIGALNGLDNLLSALYSFPGGYLSDRLGTKRALLIFNLISMIGFLIVIFIPHWIAVLVGAFFFISWTAISLPATMDLVSRVMPKNRRTFGVSLHSFFRRIPMSLGPIFGGLCIRQWGESTGVRAAFVGALGMAILAVILQQTLIEDHGPNQAVPEGASDGERLHWKYLRLMNPALVKLLISDILIRFCEQIPYAFAVVWCMKTIASPVTAPEFGILTAVEMVTAMLVYIPVAYLADRSAKKPFVVITFINFTLFPLVLWASRSFWPLVGAFIVRGLKEFGEPTRKALILDLASEDHKAATFGVYYLLRDVVVSVAAFGGAFLWEAGPAVNFVTAAAFGAIGTIWFALKGEDLVPEVKLAAKTPRTPR